MDEKCVFIDKLAAWLSGCADPPVCYAGLHRTRSYNSPAALAGLMFQASGDYGEWCVAGKPWRLPVNHLSVGSSHHGSASPEPKEPVELWAVAFNLDGVPEFDYLWESPQREVVLVNDPARLITAFQKTASSYLIRHETDTLFLKAALLELMAVARSEFHGVPAKQERPDAVNKAIEWMNGHFHEPEVCLKDVATAAELSVHHFGRTFSEAMGKSAMRYLREMRIRHSCGLLQGTELRINEIAFAVGFRDPLHFSRVFHEYNDKSPRAYRCEVRQRSVF